MMITQTGIDPAELPDNKLDSTNYNYKNEKGFPKIIDMSEDSLTKDVYIKAFLLNDKINKNYWNIPNDYIRKYASGFIGRPLIAHPSLDHPDYIKEGSIAGLDNIDTETYLEEALKIQDKYKVGEIVDVKEEASRETPGETAWFAYIRMTDPHITKALKEGSIPFYVSPQVYDTADVVTDTTKDFVPLHLAIVDLPAYGSHARVKGVCDGSNVVCSKALKSAAENLVNEIVNYTGASTAKINNHSSYDQNLNNINHKLNPNEMNNLGNGANQATVPGQLVSYQNKMESIGPNGEKIIKEEKQNVQGHGRNVTNPARVGTNPELEQPPQVGGSGNPTQKESSQVISNEPQKAPPVNPDVNSSGTTIANSAQIPTSEIQLPAEVVAALKSIPQLQQQINDLSEFKKGIVDERQKKAGEEQLSLLESFFTPEVIADEQARSDIINFFAGLNLPNEPLQRILEMIVNGGFKAASQDSNGKKVEKKHQIKSAAYKATAIMVDPYGRGPSSQSSMFGEDVAWDNIV